MTAGPWRPVRLEVSAAYIEDVHVKYDLCEDLSVVQGNVQVEADGPFDEARLSIRFQNNLVFSSVAVASPEDRVNIAFTIGTWTLQPSSPHCMALADHILLEDPKVWYPAGYGDQPLYDVSVDIVKNGDILDSWTRRTGFRRSELVQDHDTHGQSFFFRVNNIDVFCGGSCWIPADNFLPRIDPDKYRKWLQLMVEGNQIMTRQAPTKLSVQKQLR